MLQARLSSARLRLSHHYHLMVMPIPLLHFTFGSTDSENLDRGSTDYLERVAKRRQKSMNDFFAKKSKYNKINKKENKTNKKVTFCDEVEVNDVPK